MTDEMMSLRNLLEKSADADLLREMVGFAAQRLMELEVESLTGAAHGERNPDTGRDDRILVPQPTDFMSVCLRAASRRLLCIAYVTSRSWAFLRVPNGG